MNRRTFLSAVAATSLIKAAPIGIIDAHVHFYDPWRPQGVPWPASKSDPLYRPVLPGPWEEMVKPMGVTGVVVVEASPWLEDNQWILDLAEAHPVITGFVGHLEPGRTGFGSNLDRFEKKPVFRGIRLGEAALRDCLSNPSAMRDLRLLSDARLTLDVLGGSAMLADVARLSDRLASLTIVIDHLPFEQPTGELDALRARHNVFAKVSGVLRRVNGIVPESGAYYREALDSLWAVFSQERVIYASNWPVCERFGSYATVLKVVREYTEAKGEIALSSFFRSNAERAYGLSLKR